MTYEICTPQDYPLEGRGRTFREFSRAVSGPACLILSVLLGSSFLYVRFAATNGNGDEKTAAPAQVAMQTGEAAPAAPPNPYGELLNPTFSLGAVPIPFAQSAPLRAGFDPARTAEAARTTVAATEKVIAAPVPEVPQFLQSVPVPMPRPSDLVAQSTTNASKPEGRQTAPSRTAAWSPQAAPADTRSIFAKLFGMGDQQPGPALAYANPEDGAVRSTPAAPSVAAQPAGAYDRYTAVYDITARTVYLPDGRRLEAHSGLGDRLDNPRYVNERMRGATPPHVYDLTLRESLFHGVQALRLTPIGDGDVYGRAGLLVHRYMLGPNGDSNGCVSVKDYEAFLQAYRNGEIRRLAVVARLN
ncbi:DUF2778 domain-containing protein [Methyloferula stellata]|uniref:DUF2778 domain-containing protein n=1 Tax=Methyloferula stellata TaxID=876270 RepID=UPI001FCB1EAF|nr:DUF2778 domain-containing protein [Methyloferula stellata]